MLKKSLILGTIFVLILGTLSHFFYEWSGNNAIVGIFSPVDESVPEHMKLVFYPMLLFSIGIYPFLKKAYPRIGFALFVGLLAATFAIPILFYAYTFILGRDYLILDILVFVVSVVLGFRIVYSLAG